MDHDEIRRALSDYLDGALAPAEQETVEEHIRTCARCSDALRELRKTVEHVKELEQVEPPAWMTRKIMDRVRGVERKERGLLQMLFVPLPVKLPLEALGAVLLAVTAFFLYQNMQPAGRYTEQAAPVFQQTAPPELQKERPKKDKTAPEVQAVPQKPEFKARDMKKAYEAPRPPVTEKKGRALQSGPFRQPDRPEAAGNEGFAGQWAEEPRSAPRIMQDKASPEGFAAAKDDKQKGPGVRQETAQTGTGSRASDGAALGRRKTGSAGKSAAQQPGTRISLAVRSIPAASAQIEKTVKELDGSVIRKEASRGRLDLTLKLLPERTPLLIDHLKKLGVVQTTGGTKRDVITLQLVEETR